MKLVKICTGLIFALLFIWGMRTGYSITQFFVADSPPQTRRVSNQKFERSNRPKLTEDKKPVEVKSYSSVAEYFKAGNPNATTYRH